MEGIFGNLLHADCLQMKRFAGRLFLAGEMFYRILRFHFTCTVCRINQHFICEFFLLQLRFTSIDNRSREALPGGSDEITPAEGRSETTDNLLYTLQ